MVMQIKGKFIQNAALSSDKILLKAGEALRILAQDGSEKRLIELSANGKVFVNGSEVALKSDIVNTSASIESSLAAEVAAREAADTVLDGKITTEKNRAEAAEAALQAAINAEQSARQAAVAAEQATRQADDAALQAGLAAEEAARVSGDASTLASANSYTDSKVAALVNSAPEVLDTLKELADALNGDENFATSITGQIGAVSASVVAEQVRASSAENLLTVALTAEETRATAAEAGLASDIAAEAARATAAESALSASISAEQAARIAAVSAEQSRAETAEAGLAADISAEESRAMAAESALDARLDVVEGNGAGSIAKAQSDAQAFASAAVATEQSRAQGVEAGLDSRLTTAESGLAQEISNRVAAVAAEQSRAEMAEGALQAAIDTEVMARLDAMDIEQVMRQNSDNALSARLDVIEGSGVGSVAKAEADAKAYADQKVADLVNSAPAVLDTLKELADAINGDENFASTVAGQIGGVQSSLNSEISRALSAEAALSIAISDEESARMAAVSAEQSRAEAAESALDGRVSTLEAKAFYKEKFVLSAQDISNGYIEFARGAVSNSVVAFADRLAIHQGLDQDYTVSVVGGKTRMTFVNNLIDPSPEKLSEGDVINVTYMA